MKLVVNEITEEIGKKLVELGYTDSSNLYNMNHATFYKEYGKNNRFSLILNPYTEPYNTIHIGYTDEDVSECEEIDECCDLSEIYEDLQILIDSGIVERR